MSAASSPRPLVLAALAALTGVVADAWLAPANAPWFLFGLSALALGLVAWLVGSERLVSLGILAAAAFAFADWHGSRTRRFAIDDIGNFVGSERRLATVEGIVASPIQVRAAMTPTFAPWRNQINCSFTLRVERIADEIDFKPAAGNLKVVVAGALQSVGRGDRLRLVGYLSRPAKPQNTGEFDYAAYLLRCRIRATFQCESTEAINRLQTAVGWQPLRWIDECRSAGDRIFARSLPPSQASIASALVLGKLNALPDEEIEPFLESGTLHLLVVSGMHLVIVFRLVWPLLSALGMSLRATSLIMLPVVFCYALLTGGDAPVMRAAIAVGLALLARAIERPFDPLTGLAAAALALLAFDPTTAFQGGVQLSFAAMLAIHLFSRPLTNRASLESPAVDDGVLFAEPSRLGRAVALVRDELLTSCIVWTLLAPLLAHRYHLVSPAAILLTPLFGPLATCSMVLGPIVLLLAGLSPAVASPLVQLLRSVIWLMQQGVRWVENVPYGFVYVAGFAASWAIVFYAVLFLPRLIGRDGRYRRLQWAALLGWIGLGIAGEWRPSRPVGLEMHQLAVGHGLATVLRFPNGATMLYDCGSLRGPEIAERTIAPWLWRHGCQRLHAIVISHGDVDHFCSLAGLLRRFAVDAVYLTPQFARSKEPAVVELLADLTRRRVPVRLIWRGDQWIANEATLHVLHPPPLHDYESDNAASATVDVSWRSQRWLLTGDLHGSGLKEVVTTARGGFVAFAAPHHGGRTSNTRAVAAWARPRVVVASDGPRQSKTDPLAIYRTASGAECFDTGHDGGISLCATADGLFVHSFASKRIVRIAVAPGDVPATSNGPVQPNSSTFGP